MTTVTIAEPVAPASAPALASRDKGLRAGALGLISSVVIAVSSTAPAYSMAATLGLIVAVVGVHSPGTLIVSFLPMLCIAYAFRELEVMAIARTEVGAGLSNADDRFARGELRAGQAIIKITLQIERSHSRIVWIVEPQLRS